MSSKFTPLSHEGFSAHRELEALLKKDVRGEVRFDLGSRALYANDSSNYRQLPVGVVYPRDGADVEAAVAACRMMGAAILPRGGGTSLAGQCVNVAVVFDYSHHMNALVSLDPEAKLATIQPGIVLDRLREAAEVYQLTYAPDPATHARCTLGGILGNNSCGVHGLLGGKAVDNVESMEVVLYDGTPMTVGPTSPEYLDAIIRAGGRRGQIYAGLKGLGDRYGSLIREKFPRIPRRVSGYNLDELLPGGSFNVARALVGSEGTCVNILSATVNLTKSPQHRVLVVLGFPDAFLAADAVPAALEHKPIGLEGFDGMLVDFMRRKGLRLRDIEKLPEGIGFLLVEMGADTAVEARARAEAVASAAKWWPGAPSAHICTPEEAASVWHIRESALGAVVFVPGEPNRFEGWDDAAVPPERLGEYLRAIHSLMREFGYSSPFYGHYGQGCVHMRVNFDFTTAEGVRKFREFLDRAADLVVSFGGSLSGEHGDGQARSALLPKMFGPELVEAFREFKTLWDPANRMNPGKLSDAVRVYDPVENLRHKPHEPGEQHLEPETHFVFARDHGSFESAAERCVGVGSCRNAKGGTMCPSYRGTGEEKYSTRGRARLLWEMMAGALREEGFKSHAALDAIDLCLSCKACKTECPVQVDMTQYKAEFLAQHYKGRLHPLRHYLFGFADKLARLGALTPAISNAILSGPVTGSLFKRFAGIAAERKTPRLAASSYTKTGVTLTPHVALPPIPAKPDADWNSGCAPVPPPPPQPVVLWPDTWNNYYHPTALSAAEKVLTQAGFKVELPQGHVCCGRALYDFGFLGAARSYLARVLDKMAAQIDAGVPFIFLEPSCASVFKDELPELFPVDERAKKLSGQVWLLADWLQEKAPGFAEGRLDGAKVLVHGHCHHKAVFGGPGSEVALLRRAGATVDEIQAGCCGMAGPFGFEREKFEVSKRIASQELLPAVEQASPETVIVADGFSCREQINQLGGREAVHFAEALARGCGGGK